MGWHLSGVGVGEDLAHRSRLGLGDEFGNCPGNQEQVGAPGCFGLDVGITAEKEEDEDDDAIKTKTEQKEDHDQNRTKRG